MGHSRTLLSFCCANTHTEWESATRGGGLGLLSPTFPIKSEPSLAPQLGARPCPGSFQKGRGGLLSTGHPLAGWCLRSFPKGTLLGAETSCHLPTCPASVSLLPCFSHPPRTTTRSVTGKSTENVTRKSSRYLPESLRLAREEFGEDVKM
jgi:hypothetical protein